MLFLLHQWLATDPRHLLIVKATSGWIWFTCCCYFTFLEVFIITNHLVKCLLIFGFTGMATMLLSRNYSFLSLFWTAFFWFDILVVIIIIFRYKFLLKLLVILSSQHVLCYKRQLLFFPFIAINQALPDTSSLLVYP